MQKDLAIDEIRAVRHIISERFGHDTKALLNHYRELEKKYADRILPTVLHLICIRRSIKSRFDMRRSIKISDYQKN